MHDYVTWLRDSSPYINSHRDRTFVVMLPGDGVEHANFANIVHDRAAAQPGVRLVLVFGSRPQIEARLAARGITPRFHRDLRITDGPTMECVIDAVGQLRIAPEARLSMDKAASPMQGRTPAGGPATVTARPIGVLDGVDLHHTGEVRRIDRKGIGRLLDERTIVLLSPLGYSPPERSSTACEDVATRAAIDLQADKLVLYGAETGLLDESGKLVRELRPQQIPAYVERLGSQYQAELLDAAAQACRGGVRRSHVVSYVDDGALLNELFTRDGAGTLVTQSSVRATARGDHRGCRRADRSDHPVGRAGHSGAALTRGAGTRGRAVQHRRARRVDHRLRSALSDRRLGCRRAGLPGGQSGIPSWRARRRVARTHRGACPGAGAEEADRAHHAYRALVRERGFEPISVDRLPAARLAVQLPAQLEDLRKAALNRRRAHGPAFPSVQGSSTVPLSCTVLGTRRSSACTGDGSHKASAPLDRRD